MLEKEGRMRSSYKSILGGKFGFRKNGKRTTPLRYGDRTIKVICRRPICVEDRLWKSEVHKS